jgi:hypothetical protein
VPVRVDVATMATAVALPMAPPMVRRMGVDAGGGAGVVCGGGLEDQGAEAAEGESVGQPEYGAAGGDGGGLVVEEGEPEQTEGRQYDAALEDTTGTDPASEPRG